MSSDLYQDPQLHDFLKTHPPSLMGQLSSRRIQLIYARRRRTSHSPRLGILPKLVYEVGTQSNCGISSHRQSSTCHAANVVRAQGTEVVKNDCSCRGWGERRKLRCCANCWFSRPSPMLEELQGNGPFRPHICPLCKDVDDTADMALFPRNHSQWEHALKKLKKTKKRKIGPPGNAADMPPKQV